LDSSKRGDAAKLQQIIDVEKSFRTGEMGLQQKKFASAEEAFKAAGCPEKLKILVAEGVDHKVTTEQNAAALEWFLKWLK